MLVHGKGDDCDDDHLDNESSITTVVTIKRKYFEILLWIDVFPERDFG